MPGETREDFNQTIDMYQKLLEINPNVNISGGNFLPYPGAELYYEAIKAGFVPPTTTEGWKTLDRWKDDMEITWVDWLTSKEVVKIRKTIQILTSLSRYDIPVLKNWIRYRLSEGNYTMPIDLWLLRKLRIKYMQGNEKQISTKLVRSVVNTVTGQNRKYYWN